MAPDPKPDPWRDLDAVTDADACGPWHDADAEAGGRPASDPWDQLEGRLDPAEAERQLEEVIEEIIGQVPAEEADPADPARRRPQSQ